MPTFRASLFPDTSVVADFKAWTQFISNNLTSFGLVKTADTGQVDLTALTAVTTSNAYAGYEIRKFGDALQATSPLFFRIDYGAGSTVSAPSIKIQTGTGSNGSGVLLNPSATYVLNQTPLSTTAPNDCLMSGDVNRFSLLMFRGITASIILSIERAHDSSGNDTGEYWTVVAGGNSASSTPSAIHYTQRADGLIVVCSGSGSNLPVNFISQIGGGLLLSGNVGILPIPPVLGYLRNPITGLWCARGADWVDGDDVQITIYPGISHRYIVSKTGSGGFGPTSSNWCAGVRFD